MMLIKELYARLQEIRDEFGPIDYGQVIISINTIDGIKSREATGVKFDASTGTLTISERDSY